MFGERKGDKIKKMPDIFIAPPTNTQSPAPEKEPQATPPLETPRLQLTASPFSALILNPKGINFQDQDKDEEVILLLRRHWVTNVPWILVGSLMLLAPFLLAFFLPLLTIQLSLAMIVIGVVFWYLFSFGYLFVNFLIWYFNAHLVSNKRILDIDFHGLTYKEVSFAYLDKIQDINLRVGGFIRHIFDYGDVFIQTAGTEPNFDFNDIPKPAFVADKLTDLLNPKEEAHES